MSVSNGFCCRFKEWILSTAVGVKCWNIYVRRYGADMIRGEIQRINPGTLGSDQAIGEAVNNIFKRCYFQCTSNPEEMRDKIQKQLQDDLVVDANFAGAYQSGGVSLLDDEGRPPSPFRPVGASGGGLILSHVSARSATPSPRQSASQLFLKYRNVGRMGVSVTFVRVGNDTRFPRSEAAKLNQFIKNCRERLLDKNELEQAVDAFVKQFKGISAIIEEPVS